MSVVAACVIRAVHARGAMRDLNCVRWDEVNLQVFSIGSIRGSGPLSTDQFLHAGLGEGKPKPALLRIRMDDQPGRRPSPFKQAGNQPD